MEQSPPPQKKRRGGKVYSGCSTCRLRKIRCLGGTPICLNCKRSRRYICDGNGGEPIQPGDNSRPLHAETRPTKRPGAAAQHARLPSIDALPSTVSDDVLLSELSILPLEQNHDMFDKAFSLQGSFDTLDFDLDAYENATNAFASQCFDPPFFPEARAASPVSVAGFVANMPLSSTSIAPHARSMESLLEHWKSFICPIMIPTAAPSKNPYLQIYLPMALSEPRTEAKKCLLLAMLSVAAHSRAELSKRGKSDLRRQASELKEEAGASLRMLVVKLASNAFDDTDKESMMTAALTMTTIEVFSGEDKGTAYESLLLAKQIVQLAGGVQWWLRTPSRSTLLNIFRCHEILAHTSGWRRFEKQLTIDHVDNISTSTMSPEDPLLPTQQGIVSTPSAIDDNYSLDISFGVSKFSLKCLNKILELSAVKESMVEGKGEDWTELHSRDLKVLEREVFDALQDHDLLTFPDQSELSYQEGISSYISEELTQNHVLAFHNAVAIFYKRALCDGSATGTASQVTGQELVSNTFSYLENIDAIAGDTGIANTLWPAFIAAVEAVDTQLRHRALIWFARAKRHGIGNIAKAKQLAMEVWRRVDRLGHGQCGLRPSTAGLSVAAGSKNTELGSVDWRKVMEEMGMYIMLT